ncbi:hypothetical protein [Methanobacterium sp.]|uniref:hypothetical protein n=1 Tax=Methanobacterium sp. TaxID=2164 RepID=UPI002AB9911F|nr:hypothetical protein [Methanobacterium sp.]MDY9922756.1 hypothetical protein [Methanobacterium sp.]
MVNKLCCTCGEVKPMEKFPKKIVGHRREAECEDCIKNKPMVRQRPRILGKSPRPPRLGKIHAPRKVVEVVPDTHRQQVNDERARKTWDDIIRGYAQNQDWFTARDVKPQINYSLQVTMQILNDLSKLGYLEKKTDHRVKQYRMKNELINHEEAGLILE